MNNNLIEHMAIEQVDSDVDLEMDQSSHLDAELDAVIDHYADVSGDTHLVATRLEKKRHTVDLEQLEYNKKIVLAFNDAAINQKDFIAAQQYVSPNYIQHNPTAETGATGLRDWIEQFKVAFPDAWLDVKTVIAEGDRVVLHSLGLNGPLKNGAVIVDIFRVENGLVAEHWDVIQAIPEDAKNANSMF
jgi:predicted SnoaL-like aldol condensation-catalyzing enzyme